MAGCDETDQPQTAFIQVVGIHHGTPPVSTHWNWRMTPPIHKEAGVLALAMA